MYTIVFKFNDGSVSGHVCPTKSVRNRVLQDVMHHAGDKVEAWRGADSTGWDIESGVGVWQTIQTEPQHMRVEWA
jgi:hypothetical protein